MPVDVVGQKLAKEAITKSLEATKGLEPTPGKSEGSAFNDLLQAMQSDDLKLGEMGTVTDDLGLGGKFGVMSAEGIEMTAEGVAPVEPSGAAKLVDFLEGVNDLQGRMDSIVTEVLYSGKQFSMQELLAIQAFVHHAAEVTELTVKVFDQGTSSFRQIQQTQV